MKESLKVPIFHLTDEIEITKLQSVLNSFKKILISDEQRISLLPIIIKALSLALEDFPNVLLH